MLDTRRHLRTLIHLDYKVHLPSTLFLFLASLLLAASAAWIPTYPGLSPQGHTTLFIMLFAAGLWVTEAIPAFAVSLLIIALEIVLLGFPGFDFAAGGHEWELYLKPWSSPLVFLFFAGFVMAAAASKTKLDLWVAKRVLFFTGGRPAGVMAGLVGVTFFFSMFVSNTATAAMMLAVLAPILTSMKEGNPFHKAVLLGVTLAANVGGMATIIGTPPNAIAVGILGANAPSFSGWMALALPPAAALVTLLGFLLYKLYPSNEARLDLEGLRNVEHFDDSTKNFTQVPTVPSWKKGVVVLVFALTVGLWLTAPIHHVPTAVVSLLPVVAFTIFGIIDVQEIQSIRWDVILLIVGGLALGTAVSQTGLADWFVHVAIPDHLPLFVLVLAFAYVVVAVSNFMSNTAAANILLPIVVAVAASMGPEAGTPAVVAVALSASLAMCLPVSTPPNAIVYASGYLSSADFLKLGLTAALFGPPIVLGWLSLTTHL